MSQSDDFEDEEFEVSPTNEQKREDSTANTKARAEAMAAKASEMAKNRTQADNGNEGEEVSKSSPKKRKRTDDGASASGASKSRKTSKTSKAKDVPPIQEEDKEVQEDKEETGSGEETEEDQPQSKPKPKKPKAAKAAKPKSSSPWVQENTAKRHRKGLGDAADRLSDNAMRRLALRAGVKVVTGPMLPYLKAVVKERTQKVTETALIVMAHNRRKMLKPHDVLHALDTMGTRMYA